MSESCYFCEDEVAPLESVALESKRSIGQSNMCDSKNLTASILSSFEIPNLFGSACLESPYPAKLALVKVVSGDCSTSTPRNISIINNDCLGINPVVFGSSSCSVPVFDSRKIHISRTHFSTTFPLSQHYAVVEIVNKWLSTSLGAVDVIVEFESDQHLWKVVASSKFSSTRFNIRLIVLSTEAPSVISVEAQCLFGDSILFHQLYRMLRDFIKQTVAPTSQIIDRDDSRSEDMNSTNLQPIAKDMKPLFAVGDSMKSLLTAEAVAVGTRQVRNWLMQDATEALRFVGSSIEARIWGQSDSGGLPKEASTDEIENKSISLKAFSSSNCSLLKSSSPSSSEGPIVPPSPLVSLQSALMVELSEVLTLASNAFLLGDEDITNNSTTSRSKITLNPFAMHEPICAPSSSSSPSYDDTALAGVSLQLLQVMTMAGQCLAALAHQCHHVHSKLSKDVELTTVFQDILRCSVGTAFTERSSRNTLAGGSMAAPEKCEAEVSEELRRVDSTSTTICLGVRASPLTERGWAMSCAAAAVELLVLVNAPHDGYFRMLWSRVWRVCGNRVPVPHNRVLSVYLQIESACAWLS